MTTGLCDPHEIATLAREGKLEALDRLTRCHGERLLAVGRRYCRVEEEAQDAVQEAMLAAGNHLADFRGEGPLEGWVVRMVARACGRMRRGQKHDPALHLPEVEVESDEDNPELEAARAQLAGVLGEALLVLSPQDRAMVVLAEAEGWTGPEIAREMGLKPAAVRARLSRARRKLRDALAERLPAER